MRKVNKGKNLNLIKSVIREQVDSDNINFVNLTPHPVTIRNKDEEFTIKPSGDIARLDNKMVEVNDYPFPAVKKEVGDVKNLPSPKENTYYIVSSMILDNVDRDDIIAPNTQNAIRDDNGKIEAVPNFIVNE